MSQTPSDAPTVLIVDDTTMLRESLALALRINGFDVVCSENGPQAIHELRKHDPDLVLLDILSKATDGFDLLRAIRDNKSLPQPPVLVLTTAADRRSVLEAAKLGARGYLLKAAFGVESLLDRISQCIELIDTVDGGYSQDRVGAKVGADGQERSLLDLPMRDDAAGFVDTADGDDDGDGFDAQSSAAHHAGSVRGGGRDERRRYFRIEAFSLPLVADVGMAESCPVLDIGFGGFAVLSTVPLKPGAQVDASLRHRREVGHGSVRVTNCCQTKGEGYRCGVRVTGEGSTLSRLVRDLTMRAQRSRLQDRPMG